MVIGIILTVFVIYVLSSIRIVRQAEAMVIERIGKYNRTIGPGIHIVWRIFESPRAMQWKYVQETLDGRTTVVRTVNERIDLRETVYDFPKQNVITKDNVVLEIDAILYFRIVDPVKAVYEVVNLPDAIEKLAQTTLRNVIGKMDLDETLSSRDKINAELKTVMEDATTKWGVEIKRVELQNINPPKNIQETMEKQMRAERDKRAVILEAEGERDANINRSEGIKQAEINKAEGDKQAKILQAEGEAEARVKVAEAEAKAIQIIMNTIQSKGDPLNYLIATKYIDTLKEMVSGQNNKVIYLPYEASALLGSIGGIKDMFHERKSSE